MALALGIAVFVAGFVNATTETQIVESLRRENAEVKEKAAQWEVEKAHLKHENKELKHKVGSKGSETPADMIWQAHRAMEHDLGDVDDTPTSDGALQAARASTCTALDGLREGFLCNPKSGAPLQSVAKALDATSDAEEVVEELAPGSNCSDSKYMAKPYTRPIYETTSDGKTVINETNHTSRCAYYIDRAARPCESEYFKNDCGKLCGKGTNAAHMDKPYKRREPVLENGQCKKKKYTTKCDYHKVRGGCESDERRVKHETDRAAKDASYTPQFQSKCQSTCTGNGTDDAAYNQTYTSCEWKITEFETRCAYEKKRLESPCEYSSHMQRYCNQTCTGKGENKGHYAQPYRSRRPVIKEMKTYANRCLWVKDTGKCGSKYEAGCKRTCKSCATCKDYSGGCPHWVNQYPSFCNNTRYESRAIYCPQKCGHCQATLADAIVEVQMDVQTLQG